MLELRVHDSSDFKASGIFDGNNELTLTCGEESESNADSHYDADTESDCGCGENQLAHYEIDGTVRTDLRERCRRYVNGPIGGAESESTPGDHSTNDESDTKPETIENNSMSVGIPSVGSIAQIAPPANQLQKVEQVKKRPPLRKRIACWKNRVEAARKSSKKQKRTTCHGSGSVEGEDFQVTLNVLGNSSKLNITISTRR
ncbi:hypothetical protein BJ165DRAFT_1524056 [Panaeolus papilionaceus]|nr:hypothetical protein BJ165DRAFT_1524056 [Panaeolus papilionaceus]